MVDPAPVPLERLIDELRELLHFDGSIVTSRCARGETRAFAQPRATQALHEEIWLPNQDSDVTPSPVLCNPRPILLGSLLRAGPPRRAYWGMRLG